MGWQVTCSSCVEALADRDETVPPVPKLKRVKPAEGRARYVNPEDDEFEEATRSCSTNELEFVPVNNWELGEVRSEVMPPASEVSETTSGGTRLIQKWLSTSVALAIIPVRTMMETHVGLARAAVVASRPSWQGQDARGICVGQATNSSLDR